MPLVPREFGQWLFYSDSLFPPCFPHSAYPSPTHRSYPSHPPLPRLATATLIFIPHPYHLPPRVFLPVEGPPPPPRVGGVGGGARPTAGWEPLHCPPPQDPLFIYLKRLTVSPRLYLFKKVGFIYRVCFFLAVGGRTSLTSGFLKVESTLSSSSWLGGSSFVRKNQPAFPAL